MLLRGLHFDHEDGVSNCLRNIVNHVPDYTALRVIREHIARKVYVLLHYGSGAMCLRPRAGL
jgi:hypothetical protein